MVFDAVLRIPVVIAGVPRQLSGEGGEHVVEGPGEDHLVVTVHEEDNSGRTPTKS